MNPFSGVSFQHGRMHGLEFKGRRSTTSLPWSSSVVINGVLNHRGIFEAILASPLHQFFPSAQKNDTRICCVRLPTAINEFFVVSFLDRKYREATHPLWTRSGEEQSGSLSSVMLSDPASNAVLGAAFWPLQNPESMKGRR